MPEPAIMATFSSSTLGAGEEDPQVRAGEYTAAPWEQPASHDQASLYARGGLEARPGDDGDLVMAFSPEDSMGDFLPPAVDAPPAAELNAGILWVDDASASSEGGPGPLGLGRTSPPVVAEGLLPGSELAAAPMSEAVGAAVHSVPSGDGASASSPLIVPAPGDQEGGDPAAVQGNPGPDGADVVFGIPIVDSGLTKIVRRVIILSAVGATFYVVQFVVNLMRGQYTQRDAASLWTAMSSLLIELSVPACGYYGARHNNRQLTCCFCSCNLFVTIVAIMSLVRLELRIGELNGNCELEQNAQQKRSCEIWTSHGPEKAIMVSRRSSSRSRTRPTASAACANELWRGP